MPNMYAALYRDVHEMIDKRGSLLHPRKTGSTFRNYQRYVVRNRFKIAGGVVKIVAAGVLTGGIGAAVVATAMVLTYAGNGVYRRVRSESARENLELIAQNNVRPTKAGTITTITKLPNDPLGRNVHSTVASGSQVVDPLFSIALTEIANLCKHGVLTRITTSFAELEDDCISLKEAMIVRHVSSCDQCWSLLEHVERVKLRKADLKDSLELLDEFVNYVKSVLADYTFSGNHAFEYRRKRAVQNLINNCGFAEGFYGDYIENPLQLLNDAANSGDVFNTRFFSKDYSAWIIKHNPEIAPPANMKNSPVVSDGLASQGAFAARTLASKVAEGAAVNGAKVGKLVAESTIKGVNPTAALTSGSQGVAGATLSGVAAGASSAGIGIGVDVITMTLERYVNRDLLQKALDRVDGAIDKQTVAALRYGAKQIIELVAQKVEHLVAADFDLDFVNMSGTPAPVIAKALMRRQKLEDQVDALTPLLFMFHDATCGRAKELIEESESFQDEINFLINTWLDSHWGDPCNHGSVVCYKDAYESLKYELDHRGMKVSLDDLSKSNLEKVLKGRPVHPGPSGEGGLRKFLDQL